MHLGEVGCPIAWPAQPCSHLEKGAGGVFMMELVACSIKNGLPFLTACLFQGGEEAA